MKKKALMGGLAALGMLSSAALLAADAPGFYLGAGIGQATVEDDGTGFDADDTAFKIFGGYAFNANFAVELTYFDGGNPDQSIGGVPLEVSVDGVNLSALGRLPLNESFSLFGKLGYASYDVEASALGTSASDSDEDLSYGIGGAFTFAEKFELRAEYEAVDVADGNFNALSISALFRF